MTISFWRLIRRGARAARTATLSAITYIRKSVTSMIQQAVPRARVAFSNINYAATRINNWLSMFLSEARRDPRFKEATQRIAIILAVILCLFIILSVILSITGFGPAGPITGSLATFIQSGIGNVAAGSVFAFFQSLGMTNAIVSAIKALFSVFVILALSIYTFFL